MKILMACEDFRVGGAQVFALRLAHALAEENQVYLYSHYEDYIDDKLTKRIAPDVPVLKASIPFDWLIRKADRLLYKLGIDYSIREKIVVKHIRKVVQEYEINLVHSHMFKSDYIVAKALAGFSIPMIITMHGNYEEFLQNYLEKKKEIILHYSKKLEQTLTRINSIAYLTDKNLLVFREAALIPENGYRHILKKKIYNGFSGSIDAPNSRNELGIAEDALVFGMVARGIPEKGWETAIEAFNMLPHSKAHLVLVGWSNHVADLATKYQHQKNIHFIGYSDNPLNWIQMFDVGLLPSVYGESLPNVITEYLYCGKPAIISDIGESPYMIEHDDKQAGAVVHAKDGIIKAKDLSFYMQRYIDDQQLLRQHQILSKNAFAKFSMNYCLQNYTALYEIIHGKEATAGIGDYASLQL